MCCTVVTVTIKCGKCSERKLDQKQWEYERGIPEGTRYKELVALTEPKHGRGSMASSRALMTGGRGRNVAISARCSRKCRSWGQIAC